jgi:hypothetical protein
MKPMNIEPIMFGVFTIVLVVVNELVPRLTNRYGGEYKAYALKELRPWVYAMSVGAFCGMAFFGGIRSALYAGAMIVLAAYTIAARVYTRAG